jgi:hypothetical protein
VSLYVPYKEDNHDLPEDVKWESLTITCRWPNIEGAYAFCDDDFKKLQGIKKLILSNQSWITNDGLAYLRGIQTLHLNTTNDIGSGLVHLRGIRTLILDPSIGRLITDNDLVHFQGIHTLVMKYCPLITNDGLKHLQGIHTLKIDNERITKDGLAHLQGISKLSIHRNDSIYNEDLKYLRGIRSFKMSHNDCINNPGMAYLKGIYSLQLYVYQPMIDNEGLSYIQGINKISLIAGSDKSINDQEDIFDLDNNNILDLQWMIYTRNPDLQYHGLIGVRMNYDDAMSYFTQESCERSSNTFYMHRT